MTDLERRKRIYELCEQNEEYRIWKKQYDESHRKFTAFTDKLSPKLRNFLWSVPGSGYFVHHRMLDVICQSMRFPDEE